MKSNASGTEVLVIKKITISLNRKPGSLFFGVNNPYKKPGYRHIDSIKRLCPLVETLQCPGLLRCSHDAPAVQKS